MNLSIVADFGPAAFPLSIVVSPDGKQVFMCFRSMVFSSDGQTEQMCSAGIWSVDSGKFVHALDLPPKFVFYGTDFRNCHQGVVFTHDSQQVFLDGWSGRTPTTGIYSNVSGE